MHIGLAGAGRMGAFHAQVLAAQPDVERVTICDADPERAVQLAEQVGGVAVDDSTQLVGAGIDALVVAAATPAHAPLIKLGAGAGVPVFCEKPIAIDLAATDDALACADEAGIFLQIGFQRRFDFGFLAAREAVTSGGLGTLLSVRMATHDPSPPPAEYLAASGGIFRDLHIHDFDALRFVSGEEVVEAYAAGVARADIGIDELVDADTTAIVLRLSGGALAVATGARRDPLGYDVRMELFGDQDSLVVGLDRHTALRSVESDGLARGTRGWDFFMDRFDAAYRDQMLAFVDAVRRGASADESPCSGHDARQALLVAMACELSRAEQRPVSLDEVVTAVGGAA